MELNEAAEALDELTRFVVRQTAVLREVSFTAVSTLSTLEQFGPHRLTELAAHEGVSQPSMTAMVSRMERQEFVQRTTDPTDGRIVLVSITEAGQAMLLRRRQARVAFLTEMVGELDRQQQQELVRIAPVLRRLSDPAAVASALAAAQQVATEEDLEEK